MAEWPWRNGSRSKLITWYTPFHASGPLCHTWYESIQNWSQYRVDRRGQTDEQSVKQVSQTNVFSNAFQFRWKFRFTLISSLMEWSLQNFVHGMTAVLSWHVQKFIAIWWAATELQQDKVSIEFELQAKKVSETDTWWTGECRIPLTKDF